MLQVTTKRLYAWTAMVLAVNAVALIATRATLDMSRLHWNVLLGVQFGLFFFVFARLMLRYPSSRALSRVSGIFEVLFFLELSWLNLRLLNHLTMMAPFPFRDDLLASWDQALGFDWVAYFEFVHQHPALIAVLEESYKSLTITSVFALLGLVLLGEMQRARYFAEIFFVTAIFCLVPGAMMPAAAAVAHYIPDPSIYKNFATVPGVYHLSHFEALRAETGPIVLYPGNLPGLVTFPSFHTAGGNLLCVGYYRTRFFIPVAIYSGVMIASTPVFGGHYFVDLIAGTAVALGVAFVFRHSRTAPLAAGVRTGSTPLANQA